MIPSRGRSPEESRGYTMCAPHPGIRLLGRVALNYAKGCHHSTPSDCTQRSESVILMWTYQSLYHPPTGARVSPELSGYRSRWKCHGLSLRSPKLCYWPFWVELQQESSCTVLFELIEWDQVWCWSKGKLYSLIREWRELQACALESRLSWTD